MRALSLVPLLAAALALPLAEAAAQAPRVFTLRAEALQASRERLRAGDAALRPALERLVREADEALRLTPPAVTEKRRVPPSGDRHDYMSMGPYWWPDPTKPDGLPFIRRDGERNPEVENDYDRPRLGRVLGAVETLALARWFTGNEAYAAHAARLLRTFFLDPATRMNPHLRFGQAIPGRVDGRGIGIIETAGLTLLVDALGLLEESAEWTEADRRGMRDWLAAYLDWLRTSDHGLDEEDEHNNHGTWYDAQVVALALHLGRPDLARTILERNTRSRLQTQIAPDGRQPHELARTRSLSYSVMNLEGFSRLAELGRHVGVDLWGYRDPDGRGIRAALDFLAPYADRSRRWPDPQITPVGPAEMLPLLQRASYVLRDARYAALLRAIPADAARTHRARLLYPAPGGS